MEFTNEKKVKSLKSLLRYVVPFSYGQGGSEGEYEQIFERLKKDPTWDLVENPIEETDCYDYIRKHYTMGTDGEYDDKCVGSIWKYTNTLEKEKGFFALRYKVEEDKYLYAKIKDCGLYLLKNQIGLFWYELTFINVNAKNISIQEEVEIETLINFQNAIKELSWRAGDRKYDCVWIQTYGCLKSVEEKLDLENKTLTYTTYKKQDKKKSKEKPEPKEETLYLLSDAEEISLEYLILSGGGEFENKRLIEIQNYPFGYVIWKILKEFQPVFFSKRECSSKTEILIPDKPILYNYVLIEDPLSEDKKSTLETIAYYLTHGYKRSYKPDVNVKEKMLYPFDNILWYTEKEGCGVYAISSEDNYMFLYEAMVKRIERDYFLLYMNLLQQSYVALKMAEEIASTISSDKKLILESNTELTKKLEDLETRINLFVVKNVYASVSHIGHHNLFYEYGARQLRVKEDISMLRDGLGALEEIHRRIDEDTKRQRRELAKKQDERNSDKMNNAFAILTIISILSLPVNLYEFIQFVSNGGVTDNPEPLSPEITYSILGIVGVLFVVICLSAWPSLKKLFKYMWEDLHK